MAKRPDFRFLRGYAIDPGFSTRLDSAAVNLVTYRIPFEPIKPGPTGEYIEVMDVDPASGCWYEPVDLSSDDVSSQHGLDPSEGSPQFHQQFVYAVAMKTIWHFERALGRKVIWAPQLVRKRRPRSTNDRKLERRYVRALRIHPHAFREANAYYDPEKVAVEFGYFVAADQHEGTNYPGGLVFTCLSPDIVAHEVTHAILDSIHPRYMEDTNPDVAAFHEGFADIVALLQRFTFRELVEHEIARTAGRLDRYSILGELATQFGEALEGNRGALRSMIGRRGADGTWRALAPSPRDYTLADEAHDRGAVLVATVFDAFQRLYMHRTEDLRRIASGGTGILPDGSISTDLVRRFAGEAAEIAQHLLHICIRALDYCPPSDITYGDFLRALVTADRDIAPEDEVGYRLALIEAFRARGIFPDRVPTFSEQSLCWAPPEFTKGQKDILDALIAAITDDVRKLADELDREEHYKLAEASRIRVHQFLKTRQQNASEREWEAFLNLLGLTSRPLRELFGDRASGVRFTYDNKPAGDRIPNIEVHTFRPAFRAGREGRQVEQVLVTLTQRVNCEYDEDGERRTMVFRGGSSLILSLGAKPAVDFVVVKSIKSDRRFRAQCAYVNGDTDERPQSYSMYADEQRHWKLDFNLLHSEEAL